MLETSMHEFLLQKQFFFGEGFPLPFLGVVELLLFLQKFLKNIPILVKLIIWHLILLIRLGLPLDIFGIEGIVGLGFFSSGGPVLCLQFFGEDLIQSHGITFPLLILLHEFEDVD
jgi:hypothetical protein